MNHLNWVLNSFSSEQLVTLDLTEAPDHLVSKHIVEPLRIGQRHNPFILDVLIYHFV